MKEYLAKVLHKSRRKPGPFMAFNCAALIESELFGHVVPGTFTGACSHAGLIREASSGTLRRYAARPSGAAAQGAGRTRSSAGRHPSDLDQPSRPDGRGARRPIPQATAWAICGNWTMRWFCAQAVSTGDMIRVIDLPEELQAPALNAQAHAIGPHPRAREEAEMLRMALKSHRWNVSAVARALSINRTTVHRRLGIRPPHRGGGVSDTLTNEMIGKLLFYKPRYVRASRSQRPEQQVPVLSPHIQTGSRRCAA